MSSIARDASVPNCLGEVLGSVPYDRSGTPSYAPWPGPAQDHRREHQRLSNGTGSVQSGGRSNDHFRRRTGGSVLGFLGLTFLAGKLTTAEIDRYLAIIQTS